MKRKQPKMLIVDDDEMVRKSLARLFKASGFAVVSAQSMRGATDAMREHGDIGCFDVVVCDLMLPTHDDGGIHGPFGFELCHYMRAGQYPGHERIPFFLHTGSPEHPATANVKELGGVVWEKGDSEKLLEAIQAALKTKQA